MNDFPCCCCCSVVVVAAAATLHSAVAVLLCENCHANLLLQKIFRIGLEKLCKMRRVVLAVAFVVPSVFVLIVIFLLSCLFFPLL